MTKEILISFFVIAGAIFMLIAAIGVLRMPDIYMRMHASTKATSLALFLLLVGAMIYYPSFPVVIKSLAIIIFLYLTIPVSANLLGKSALEMNSYLWTKEEKREPDEQ